MSYSHPVTGFTCSLLITFTATVEAQPHWLLSVSDSIGTEQPPTIDLHSPDGEYHEWQLKLNWKPVTIQQQPVLSLEPDEVQLISDADTTDAISPYQLQALLEYLESGFEHRESYQKQTTISFIRQNLDGQRVDLDNLRQPYTLALSDIQVADGINWIVISDNHGNDFDYPMEGDPDRIFTWDNKRQKRMVDTPIQHYLSLLRNNCSDLYSSIQGCLSTAMSEDYRYDVAQRRIIRSTDLATDENNSTINNTTDTADNAKAPVISVKTGIAILSAITTVYSGLTTIFTAMVILICCKKKSTPPKDRQKPAEGKAPETPPSPSPSPALDSRLQGSSVHAAGPGPGSSAAADLMIRVHTEMEMKPLNSPHISASNPQPNIQTDCSGEETGLESVDEEHPLVPPSSDPPLLLVPYLSAVD